MILTRIVVATTVGVAIVALSRPVPAATFNTPQVQILKSGQQQKFSTNKKDKTRKNAKLTPKAKKSPQKSPKKKAPSVKKRKSQDVVQELGAIL